MQDQHPVPSRRSWLVITSLAIISGLWIGFSLLSDFTPVRHHWAIGFGCFLMSCAAILAIFIDFKKAE